MRITYVLNSMEGGGATGPVPAVCGLLRKLGAKVIIVALTPRDLRGLNAIEVAGFEVVVRPGGKTDHLAALAWLQERVLAACTDVIWTSLTRATLLGQIVGKRLGLPVVSWQHAAYLKPANLALLRIRRNSSALWIADSSCVADLSRRRLALSDEQLVTWPLFAADPIAPRARPWHQGEPLRIGSLGRLHDVKGYDVLLEALALLRRAPTFKARTPFNITIAGEGEARARLKAIVRRHGLEEVHMPGFCADPRAFLATLHLYVQPSRSEGFCIAAHEAMQAGLPVIASAVGEMPQSIQPGRMGGVVPPGDSEALAFALAEMLSAPERLALMGAAARRHVLDKFSGEAFERTGRRIFERVNALVHAPSAAHRSGGPARFGRSSSRRSG